MGVGMVEGWKGGGDGEGGWGGERRVEGWEGRGVGRVEGMGRGEEGGGVRRVDEWRGCVKRGREG